MKAFALLAASALALAACSGGQEAAPTRQTISEIVVDTDLQAIGNASAVGYWNSLSADLQTALAGEFVNDIAPDGALLSVDIDEISLANSYTSKFQGENSTLSGQVTLTSIQGQTMAGYTVTASSSQAMAYLPPSPSGTVSVSPDSADFYAALVKAFARGVNEAVNSVPPSGS